MKKSFDELKATAERLYDQCRDTDRDHAILFILEVVARAYHDGADETLNAVEARFAAKQ